MRKAFTLVELAVAVGLLAMMISFASLIFNVSIDTHRVAMANAEIMQKLQAITSQLNADFKGQKISLPGEISFATEQSVIAGNPRDVRSDSIVFFANGDFQSTGQYRNNKSGKEETVTGNVAVIYCGLSDVNTTDPRKKVLARRQTILTADTDFDPCDVLQYGEYWNDDGGMSPSKLIAKDANSISALLDALLLEKKGLVPQLTYMVEGVDDFTIQFAKWNGLNKKFEWVPKYEPEFDDYPVIITSAFKFTFTLYDSKGVLKDGKTFTHIVYLE